MNKSSVIFIALFALCVVTSCLDDVQTEVPRDIPVLVSPNCILPPKRAINKLYELRWKSYAWRATESFELDERLAIDSKFKNETFHVGSPDKFYCAPYNWNLGKALAKRKALTIDRSIPYIVISLETLTDIVVYLIEHVWTKGFIASFLAAIQWVR